MGLFDSIFGRTKITPGKTDQLFALSTASLDIEAKLDSRYGQVAAIVLRAVDNSAYETIEKDVHDLLAIGGKDLKVTARMVSDTIGFRWIIMEGPSLEDAINGLHMTADMVKQAGYADSLLAAMFRFADWYLIYSYRRATFYPFMPERARTRNESREFRIRQTLVNALPMEKDPERWYPLWDPPF